MHFSNLLKPVTFLKVKSVLAHLESTEGAVGLFPVQGTRLYHQA